ncbi:Ni/Fe-hydrogenase, b-type cytochrome subunit [Helicobacter mustelae]|uniref:Ni/Fe-hydrogenase B-type cytochrome subunit n=1 Tax=Helicobacter mustelae (strain ATCC 43772 / CCUG 25715 / CIP 103759 / LMG 18044 / NCTC 12198 / R85-136P) TaxID=679897 RepID=D3UIC3_HELM1|nr:Ni/Fe-hydrogenase, b-type cytochrome subunit [Helicobacter mustelae]CBG40246.1 Ni/Fe-hydrogenase B-type cytochrome subunit [Helicobacter mustelae 12198]SQH71745.1 Ni/Fe-hydrogenase B-type cytochrome subunit [Helicobacter mustelae]STP12874.1 Ni/Fe-hydrogenase B-type cytochrome subunit [Helicobacter mustelae]
MKERVFFAEREFSKLTALFHWIRAFAIFGLIFTGFYIFYPFLQGDPNHQPTGFLLAYVRSFHLMLGFSLIGVSIFRLYLFIFDKQSAPERISFKQFLQPKIWLGVIGTYLWIGKHPHIKGAYNPLQIIVYFTLAVLVLLISLTGLALYANVYHEGFGAFCGRYFNWVEVVCGGLANVRYIHHLLTWAFIFFIPVHVYLVVWNSIKYPNGGADGIISGIRYHEKS